ncbi:MAG: hypothetical protein ACOYCB_02600 [Fastidiosipilaceae bacterium]|jgi:MraZ protein|nr:hypothetical protein [Clostridiaceae bacterium]
MARYVHTTDAKGRIFIPARLRESLGGVVYVTKSLDKGYLTLYTTDQFESVREQLNQLSGTDPVARILRREIIGEALRCTLDSQGRISISNDLWSYINVKPSDEVCVIDMFDSLQICGKAFYDEQVASEPTIDELDLSAYDVKGIL